jgi:hypothetical protein
MKKNKTCVRGYTSLKVSTVLKGEQFDIDIIPYIVVFVKR